MNSIAYLAEAVSKTVLEKRAHLGISQESLSLKAGMHRTFISKIEKASQNPTIESIFRLAVAFEIEPEQLVREIKENAVELSRSRGSDEK